MTAQQMREHVEALAVAFGVHVIWNPELQHFGVARPDLMAVQVPVLKDDTDYALALHEIGHCAAPTGCLLEQKLLAYCARDAVRCLNVMLTEELAAWVWAQQHALDWTPGMEQVRALCTASYENTLASAKRMVETSPPASAS